MTASGKMRQFELARESMDDNRAEPERRPQGEEVGILGKRALSGGSPRMRRKALGGATDCRAGSRPR
jgi:hypothetical protein